MNSSPYQGPTAQDSLFEFRKQLLSILSKFADSHTLKTGIEEVKRFMATEITDNDRMNSFLNAIADHHEHMKQYQRREQIKVYGLAAEIFEEALIPFLPKILAMLAKKIKEGTTYMQEAIAETLGLMVYFIVNKLGTLFNDSMQQDDGTDEEGLHERRVEDIQASQREILDIQFFKMAFGLLEKSPSKSVQYGASLCLSKLIQNTPEELLIDQFLGSIAEKILQILTQSQFKAHSSLIECVISLIFQVDHSFVPHAPSFIPILLDFILQTNPGIQPSQKTQSQQQAVSANDWGVRKVSIDAIYSMTAIIKEDILPFANEILKVLNGCRFDKIKPVREATLETIKLIREIYVEQSGGIPIEEDQQVLNMKEHFQDNARDRSGGARSARPIKQNNFKNELEMDNVIISQQRTVKQGTLIEMQQPRGTLRNRKGSVGKEIVAQSSKQNTQMVVVPKQDIMSGEKKVSSATLKRRAAQSPQIITDDSIKNSQHAAKKEFKSIFERSKNSKFFGGEKDKEQNSDLHVEIEIYEGPKRPITSQLNQDEDKLEIIIPKISQEKIPTQQFDQNEIVDLTFKSSNPNRIQKDSVYSSSINGSEKNAKQNRTLESAESLTRVTPKNQNSKSQKPSQNQNLAKRVTRAERVINLPSKNQNNHANKFMKPVQTSSQKKKAKSDAFDNIVILEPKNNRAQQNQQEVSQSQETINLNQFQINSQIIDFVSKSEKYTEFDYPVFLANQVIQKTKKDGQNDIINHSFNGELNIERQSISFDARNNLSPSNNIHMPQSRHSTMVNYEKENEARNQIEINQQQMKSKKSLFESTAENQNGVFNGSSFDFNLTETQDRGSPNKTQRIELRNAILSQQSLKPQVVQQSYSLTRNKEILQSPTYQQIKNNQFGFQGGNQQKTQQQNIGNSLLTPVLSQIQPQISSYDNLQQGKQLTFMMMQIDKINQNQTIMCDQVRQIQDHLKLETSSLKARAAEMEALLLELRTQVNQKLNTTDLAEIIDKKLQVATLYKKDTDEFHQKYNDMRIGLQNIGAGLQSQCVPISQNPDINTFNSGPSSLEPLNSYEISHPDKKQAWRMIQGMLTRGQHNDAFAVALNVYEEDELPLVKLLSKLKTFEYEKLYEVQRQDLLKRSLAIMDAGEFFDLLIPCFSDAIDKFGILMSRQVKDTLASRLNKVLIKYVRELSQQQQKELKRITDKLMSSVNNNR